MKTIKKKEIQSGYRCKTFLLTNQRNKLIYQVYIGSTEYQARKKAYITKLIKSNTNISQIPEILDCGRNEKFSYLVSEYKDGIEMEKINKNIFNYMTFYKNLSNILVKIHSVNIGDSFGWVSENGVEKRRAFADYIKQEIKRNINRIKLIIGERKEILEQLNINFQSIKTEDGMSDGKYVTTIVFKDNSQIKLDLSAWNGIGNVTDNIESILEEYEKCYPKISKENEIKDIEI